MILATLTRRIANAQGQYWMFFQHRIFAKARNDVRIKSKRSLLDGDDPDEIAEAEALLRMLARLSDSKAQKHLDELLEDRKSVV